MKKLWSGCLSCMALFALAGCEFHPRILSAHAHRVGDSEAVEVRVPSSDAATIRRRELYFSVVVTSCDGSEDGFPMEPYIDGKRATDFKFATTGDAVRITGSIPAHLFEKYRRPCAFLRGGGYATGTLKSDRVPIE